jgi:hypothetical protein
MVTRFLAGTSKDPVQLIPRENYFEARHEGAYSHERYMEFIVRSIDACAKLGLRRMFVDISGLTGFHPSTTQRYEMGCVGSTMGNMLERVAVLGTAEQLENRFSTMVARNRGLNVQSFTDRQEALRWLLEDGGDAPLSRRPSPSG